MLTICLVKQIHPADDLVCRLEFYRMKAALVFSYECRVRKSKFLM
jgi:hypothetical protein